ncbi:MAG: Ig-like domain-containing protein [Gammaproteobacteria bacterium]|nr:Ig-like domain-containing protein [Gammaproteobacteria bacterium]
MFRKLHVFLFVIGSSIAACGTDDPESQPDPVTIDYSIWGQTLSSSDNGLVAASLYEGEERARTELLDRGMYYIWIYDVERSSTSTPTINRWMSGDYIEDADMALVTINSSDELYVAYNTSIYSRITANINYYTTLSTGLAQYSNSFAVNPVLHISVSNDAIWDLAGFNILHTNVAKVSVAPTRTYTDNEILNGYVHAAISQLTLDESVNAGNVMRMRPYTIADYITIAHNDIRYDGVLNGVGVNGTQLFMGDRAVGTEMYRHDLAVAMMKFADNPYNLLGYDKVGMLGLAIAVNDSTDSIYGETPIVAIDEGGAVISNFEPADGSSVSGDAMFSVDLVDTTGIVQVEFFIDDVHYSYGWFPNTRPLSTTSTIQFYVPVFQPDGTSGTHTVRVDVTNVYGTITSLTNTNVTFDNL